MVGEKDGCQRFDSGATGSIYYMYIHCAAHMDRDSCVYEETKKKLFIIKNIGEVVNIRFQSKKKRRLVNREVAGLGFSDLIATIPRIIGLTFSHYRKAMLYSETSKY